MCRALCECDWTWLVAVAGQGERRALRQRISFSLKLVALKPNALTG